MPRKQRRSKRRSVQGAVEPWQWLLLGLGPDRTVERDPGCVMMIIVSHRSWKKMWQSFGEQLLHAWIEERPESRPWAWWQFAAPRWQDESLLARFGEQTGLPESRNKIIGGIYQHEKWSAMLPIHDFGCYRLADPDDPAQFESEEDYLDRLDLLIDGK